MGSNPPRAVAIAVVFALFAVCSRYPVARAAGQAVCEFTGWEWVRFSV